MDRQQLIELAHARMPYGKFKGQYLIDLPEPYVLWLKNKGFPQGKLGVQLASVYEIKLNGLEALLRDIRGKFRKG